MEQDKTGTEPEHFENEVENPERFRCQVEECQTLLEFDAGYQYGDHGPVVAEYVGCYCPNPACQAGGLTQDHFIPRHVDELGKWVPRRDAEPIDYEQPLKEAKQRRRLDPEFSTRQVR